MAETKPFHKLTKTEFEKICKENITWQEVAKRYPQPEWCCYTNAVQGVMGCWSLMSLLVTGRGYCKNCDCSKMGLTNQ